MENYARVPNEVERDRSNLSGKCPVCTGKACPYPPYTPLGYKFPLKSCRLFLTRLKSMPVENFSPPKHPIP
jgi:hypothetical protein